MVSAQRQEISKKKPISINYQVFKDSNIQGIPEAVAAQRSSTRIFWVTVVILTNLACFFHVFYLLQTFEREDNETTITFGEVQQLMPPRVIVCQRSTRMLDHEKVKGVKAEDYFALELGVGLIHLASRDEIRKKIDNKSIKQRYWEILKENNGSIPKAYENFHKKNMRNCEDVFHDCYIELYTKVNCCEIFEPMFTLYGTCFVTKSNSILINQTDSLANFMFRLNFNGTERPDFLSNKKSNDADEVFNSASKKKDMEKYYDVGLIDGLDQGNFFIHHQYVAKDEWLTVNMVQKRRMLIPNEGACVSTDKVHSELDFFQEYTRTNCKWERGMLKRTILEGEYCEVPLVELLKPGYKSKSLCNLTQILEFYEKPPIIDGNEGNDDGNEATAPASPEASYFSILRKSCALEKLFLKYTEKYHNETITCLPLCDTTVHGLTMDKITDGSHLKPNEASITLQFTTKEVEKVIESPPATLAEYLALIGGTIGMWNGASLIALGQFIVLSVAAFDVRSLRDKIRSVLLKDRKREPVNTS